MPEQQGIYKAISAVMKEVGSISKDRNNPQQNYKFRGIDDVYNALHSPMSKHGLFVVPTVQDTKLRERETRNGGVLFYTTLTVLFRFYAEDGSHIEAVTIGEAMDSGDKSANKAMSAAMKYAMMQVFCIPTQDDKDSENQTHDVKPKSRKAADVEPKTPATKNQIMNIEVLADETGADIKKALDHYKVKKLDDLTSDQATAVINGLMKKKREQQESAA